MQRYISRIYRLILLIFVLAVPINLVYSQQSTGTIFGKIKDRHAHLERLILVELKELTSRATMQETKPDSLGNFVLWNVPFSSYRLEVLVDNVITLEKDIVINTSVPTYIDLDTLREYETEEILVTANNYAGSFAMGTSRTNYTAASLQTLPSQSTNKKIESLLLSTPGVVPDEDGRIHLRGEDAQVQYVIDGIPITANMTRVYSSLFDAQLIKLASIQTGNLEAEYGVAASGIINITTRSGFDKPLFIRASAGVGSFNLKEAGIQVGSNLGRKAALFFGLNSSKTDRYLDPISEGDPIHDKGSTNNLFGKLKYVITSKTDINLLAGYNTAEFEIPNSLIRTPPQDQLQNHNDYLIGIRLNTTINSNSQLGILAYGRRAYAKIASGRLMDLSKENYQRAIEQNEKFFIGGERINKSTGGQIEYSSNAGWFSQQNNFKAGLSMELYPVSERFTFAVTNPALSDSSISGGDIRLSPYDITNGGSPFFVNKSKTGQRYSAFVQNQLILKNWIVSAGIRLDYFSFLLDEFHLSPRLSATYNFSEEFFIRASYNRIVMQAPIENILVSSSEQAKKLSGITQGSVSTIVKSEKENNFELAAGYHLSKELDLELSGYRKLIKDFLVNAELGNSGIIFPINLKKGFVAGGELRARLHSWNNFSGYMSLSSCASYGIKPEDGSSPISAGLLIGQEGQNYNHPFAGEDFFPTEHNQLFTLVFNMEYNHPVGLFCGISGRFDSGLPFDLTGKNGLGLNPEESRAELKRRGYSDKVIDLLSLESEKAGSPDKSVAPHTIFDIMLGFDMKSALSLPLMITCEDIRNGYLQNLIQICTKILCQADS
jgi:hypothetical protein